MLGWIFKKKGNERGSASAAAAPSLPPVAGASAPDVDWTAALAQARGDDDALLALARTAGAPLQIKQAAVAALDGEAALKLAEREFRSHDRRVHQLAKQHLLAKVARRQAREQAERLLATARSLAAMEQVPMNRVVELDHAWQSLDAGAIEPAQRDDFVALTAQLATQLRQRADIELQQKRWQADAVAALRQLQAACTQAAAGTQDRERLAGAMSAARGVEGALPLGGVAVPAIARALADLQQANRIATALDGHLAVLDRLLAGRGETPPTAAGDPPAELDAAAPGAEAADVAGEVADKDAAPAAAVDDPQQQWQALQPLPDAHLATLLQARHARWQQACDQARQARQARQLQQREQARERQRTRKGEQAMALADRLAQAETALDAGQVADAHRHLSDIDDSLQAADAPVALHTRIVAAQARLAQLRGWQHWAGGRARDELVMQAEALAAATIGGDRGNGGREGEGDGQRGVVAEVARLSIRQRAEVIDTLRKRWKEIDRLGATGGQALWQRFDAALTAAGEPVAAHPAAQRAARQALPVLPAPLEEAMRRRAGLAPADATDTAPDVDDLLLQIEIAWDLPTPPAFESARRKRKLLAVKLSLEGGRSVATNAQAPVASLVAPLAEPHRPGRRPARTAGRHSRGLACTGPAAPVLIGASLDAAMRSRMCDPGRRS